MATVTEAQIFAYLALFVFLQITETRHKIKYYSLVAPVVVILHVLLSGETGPIDRLLSKDFNMAKAIAAGTVIGIFLA